MSNVNMEQSYASVVRYIQDNAEEGTVFYYDEIPEQFYVPSIYFPVPQVESRKATLSTYLVTLNVDVWFMAHKEWEANAAAVAMRDCILLDGLRIPYYSEEGEDINRHMHVIEPTMRRIDEGIIRLSFKVQDYFSKEEKEEPVEGFHYKFGPPANTEEPETDG